MALLQIWQLFWKEGCIGRVTESGLNEGKVRKGEKNLSKCHIFETPPQGFYSSVLNYILILCRLAATYYQATFCLVTNLLCRKKMTFQFQGCKCNQKTHLCINQLDSVFGVTFISHISSKPQIPTRCGDMITYHSIYHRAMQSIYNIIVLELKGWKLQRLT